MRKYFLAISREVEAKFFSKAFCVGEIYARAFRIIEISCFQRNIFLMNTAELTVNMLYIWVAVPGW